MTTIERTTRLPETTKPTTIESVTFRDGMIVTAEDLDAAMRYPAALLHTVLRSYFGCGVVCGLGLRVKKRSDGKPTWILCVDRGVAIDCDGHPIELCGPVELDLSPDACSCENPPPEVYVAVRRTTSDEAPRDGCTCDTDDPRFDCRRVRDHVVVKAFTKTELDALSVCRRPLPPKAEPGAGTAPGDDQKSADSGKDSPVGADPTTGKALCEALTACSPCTCGACWVLLGSVELTKEKGIVGDPDLDERKWVKPIEVVCAGLLDRIGELTDAVAELAKRKDTGAELTALADRVAALENKQSAAPGK